jgi:outer membrane protein OmpA-like peptidoglycan-associated protein
LAAARAIGCAQPSFRPFEAARAAPRVGEPHQEITGMPSRSTTRSALTRIGACAALLATLALAGCGGNSIFDDLDAAQPTGSPFSQALFKDYAYLARSFGTTSEPSDQSFDAQGSMSLTGEDATTENLAILFAQKALTAAKGEEPLPEPAPDGDADADAMRLRLLRDLDQGREKAPEDAARAQVDYDCWILNNRVTSQKAAAEQCRHSLDGSLAQLEHDLNPSPPPPPPAAQAPAADYTVYFDFDSWSLTAEALTTIQQAIATARSGGQSRITIVGHTDTVGGVAFNQRLSEKRANVVKDVMAQMGARPESIQTSGVGKTDLAVQTGDQVKEAKNRRSVITLLP